MTDAHERAEALCRAPVGCAFLLVVEDLGLAPESVVHPVVAWNIAAIAVEQVDPSRGDHHEMLRVVLAHGARLQGLARDILSLPTAAWWFTPLERRSQLWVPWIVPRGERLEPSMLHTSTGSPTSFERYAKKPEGGIYSSTMVDGISCALVALAHGAGDHYVLDPGLATPRYLLQVAKSARVFEIDGPHAWHRLCLAFPAEGQAGDVVPDWAAVAREWDAVHLSFGGLLTADQVRVESSQGWTEQWGWQTELAVWLRWSFDRAERLLDLPGLLEPSFSDALLPSFQREPLSSASQIFNLSNSRSDQDRAPSTNRRSVERRADQRTTNCPRPKPRAQASRPRMRLPAM